MRYRIKEIEIDEEQPYANDLLHRSDFGQALTNLLKNAQGEFTLGIDGQWGDGKTTFAKMWCEQLKTAGFQAIYFDAFVNDHGQDPFAPISALLLDAIRPKVETTSKETKEEFVTMGLKLLQIGSRVALRTVTAGAIDEKDIKDISDALTSNETDAAVSALEKRFAEYQINENELNAFRSLLSELAQIGRPKLPLVIILDEIDGCRPTFALSLLEKVKHFFSVEGIVFVFVMNSKEMCACIHHVYGSSIDARQYLHKFVDVECTLPAKRDNDWRESLYIVYTRHLLNAYVLDKGTDYEEIKDFLVALAEAFNLSLRDMQKACRTVALYYTALGNQGAPLPGIVCLLAVLKVCKRNTYNALANNEHDSLKTILAKLEGSSTLKYIQSWMLACTGKEDEMENECRQNFKKNYNLWQSRKQIITKSCARMDFLGE